MVKKKSVLDKAPESLLYDAKSSFSGSAIKKLKKKGGRKKGMTPNTYQALMKGNVEAKERKRKLSGKTPEQIEKEQGKWKVYKEQGGSDKMQKDKAMLEKYGFARIKKGGQKCWKYRNGQRYTKAQATAIVHADNKLVDFDKDLQLQKKLIDYDPKPVLPIEKDSSVLVLNINVGKDESGDEILQHIPITKAVMELVMHPDSGLNRDIFVDTVRRYYLDSPRDERKAFNLGVDLDMICWAAYHEMQISNAIKNKFFGDVQGHLNNYMELCEKTRINRDARLPKEQETVQKTLDLNKWQEDRGKVVDGELLDECKKLTSGKAN